MVKREDWDEVRSRERYIIKEIDPIKLLTILKRADVLSQLDCESITAAYNKNGPTHATQTELLMRLKKRGSLAFSKFVVALREVGLSHVAQLLDPKFKGKYSKMFQFKCRISVFAIDRIKRVC